MKGNNWHGIETLDKFLQTERVDYSIDRAYIRSNSKTQQVYYVMCLIQLGNSCDTYAELALVVFVMDSIIVA